MIDVEVVRPARASLGEGPVWDGAREQLVWVDIDRGRVHRWSPAEHRDVSFDVGREVGCAVPRAGGGLMLALPDGFAALAAGGERPSVVAEVEAGRPDTRMNDGACDRRGRFWAGTMSVAGAAGEAALYRLDRELRVERVLNGLSISNGVDWSPDDAWMYHVDSPRLRVDAYEFELAGGTLGARRALVELPPGRGRPDGLTVDAEGGVWVALWGGGAVQRFGPDGRLDQRIELPASQVTSCCFGDPDLATLYVTSAARGAGAREPLAGALFGCRPGVAGLPATPFGG